MDKPICHVRNLRMSALSGYVSEIDAIAAGGRFLSPDDYGWFDANMAHDLCVTCATCGAVVSRPSSEIELSCSDCGQDEFHVVQTVVSSPRRPTYAPFDLSSVPSVPPSRPSDDDVGDSPVVSPWARWAARTLDSCAFIILSCFVMAFFLGFIGCDVDNVSDFGWLVLAAPLGIVLDALCYHVFGQTAGKWLFAVKVRHQDGTRLTFQEYLKRNMWVFVQGLGLGIPVVILVAEAIQYCRLKAGKCASYDLGKDIKIVRVRHDVARTILGIVAMVVLFVILAPWCD